MKDLHYRIPESLKETAEAVKNACNSMIEGFNALCVIENKRIADERQLRLASRKFNYSIVTLEDDWKILYREAETEIEEEKGAGWSSPFKIINGVLIRADFCFKNQCHTSANELLPLGLLPEDFDLEKINVGW